MSILLLCLASLAVLAYGQGRPPAPVLYCNTAEMNACTAQLASFWNLQQADLAKFWKDRHLFDAVITAQYGRTAADYISVCNGLSLFYYCLGPDNIRNCLGVSGLTSNELSPFDAYQMDGMMNRIRFECGDAFQTIINIDELTDCVQRTKKNYAEDLGSITDRYENQVEHDSYQNMCTNGEQFLQETTAVYRSGPCSEHLHPEALPLSQWFGCNGARQHVLTQFRHCEKELSCGIFQ